MNLVLLTTISSLSVQVLAYTPSKWTSFPYLSPASLFSNKLRNGLEHSVPTAPTNAAPISQLLLLPPQQQIHFSPSSPTIFQEAISESTAPNSISVSRAVLFIVERLMYQVLLLLIASPEETGNIESSTDGSQIVLTDIQPVPPTTSPSPPSYATLHARSGYNGYNHVVAGGLLLLGNSDPISTWSETMSWLNAYREQSGIRPYGCLYAISTLGNFIGHSLKENVKVVKNNIKRYNGQWGMVVIGQGFSPD
ncbi:uncharacterized protein RCO7_01922 [Rhynchosporium graminicola]|uniref:Uncharacterized protein n=1 Tax=Rhynchosporium graminicola TaxID=2792576 RepID=A0A1E1KUA3_9HELO|nr:uncharacterized protein RCO7_01922 [Rhynchosporium commune]